MAAAVAAAGVHCGRPRGQWAGIEVFVRHTARALRGNRAAHRVGGGDRDAMTHGRPQKRTRRRRCGTNGRAGGGRENVSSTWLVVGVLYGGLDEPNGLQRILHCVIK